MSSVHFEPTRTSKLVRGHNARDVTTGIVGMVIAISPMIDGSVQVCLQPAAEKPTDKAPDPRWVDEQACEYIDDGEVARFSYAEKIGEWDFGDPVRDSITGASGIISEFQLCRNGCILACVSPKTDGGANSPQPAWVSISRLQRITDKPRVDVIPNVDSGPCDVRPGSGRQI